MKATLDDSFDAAAVRHVHNAGLSGGIRPMINADGSLLDRTVNLTMVSLLANTDVPAMLTPFADRIRSVTGLGVFSESQLHITVCPIQAYASVPPQDDPRIDAAFAAIVRRLPSLGESIPISLTRVVVAPTAVRAIGAASPSLVAFRRSLLADLKEEGFDPPYCNINIVHVNIARYSQAAPLPRLVEVTEAWPPIRVVTALREVIVELSDMNQVDHSMLRSWYLPVAP